MALKNIDRRETLRDRTPPWSFDQLHLSDVAVSLRELTPLNALLVLVCLNVVQFMMSMGIARLFNAFITRDVLFSQDELAISSPRFSEIVMTVLNNSLVAFAGWGLWRAGWITIDLTSEFGRIVADVLALFFVMDALMYISHRLAHTPLLYRWIHAKHHRAERTRPIDLFYLSQVEVWGYGGLWISLLVVYESSIEGILVYLALNILFGTIGHLGYALPMPRSSALAWLGSHLGGSKFHAEHHRSERCNYGFYTLFWDRLFKTLK